MTKTQLFPWTKCAQQRQRPLKQLQQRQQHQPFRVWLLWNWRGSCSFLRCRRHRSPCGRPNSIVRGSNHRSSRNSNQIPGFLIPGHQSQEIRTCSLSGCTSSPRGVVPQCKQTPKHPCREHSNWRDWSDQTADGWCLILPT